jgi:DNA-binding LacI/PurR family transcriptional regulator
MPKSRPTIADVAREAGVSKGLVSFALNDRPGVSAGTRERILGVANELGWRPSVRARSLSTDRAFALGLVIARDPEIISGDPFFPAFIAGVEKALAPAGQVLVLSMVADEASEIATYRQLAIGGRVDGVIITDLRKNDSRIELAASLSLRAVTLGVADIPTDLPSVSLDDAAGIRAAVDHLVSLGHSRIAHVSGPFRMLHGQRRSDSFQAAMRSHGLTDLTIIETDFTAADGARATRELLDARSRPTAIVYANDPMAIAGLGVAQRAGLDVPRSLSITGFDGSEIGAYIHPALTTVTTRAVDWGQRAAELLLRVINGEEVENVELAPAALLVRESTAPPSP